MKAAIQKIVDDNLADGFGHAATLALLVSACFAVAAFLLVFALPKRVSQGYEAPPAGEYGSRSGVSRCARPRRIGPRPGARRGVARALARCVRACARRGG